jgi:hypothetical protein
MRGFSRSGWTNPALGGRVALYTGSLVGLVGWPNVRATYAYGGTPQAPLLLLRLGLNGAVYAERALAEADAKTFEATYRQLTQDNRIVSMTIENTLLADPEAPLGGAQAEPLREFAGACRDHLLARAEGVEGLGWPAVEVEVPLSSQPRPDPNIPLAVSLRIEGRERETTAVRPAADAGDDPKVFLRSFAAEFERVFEAADSTLRIGVGAPAPGAFAATRDFPLWAVRTRRAPEGPGLGFSLVDEPAFYAPQPPARSARSGEARVGAYVSNKPFPAGSRKLSFADVDLEAWAGTALGAIDDFLDAYAEPALRVDQLTVPNPEAEGRLAKILAHKKTIARSIAARVEPILAAGAPDEASREAARGKVEEALRERLSRLSDFPAAACVAVLPVAGARYGEPLPEGGAAPRFYGRPAARGEEDDDFSLSAAAVPLTTGADGASRLAFLFEPGAPEAARCLPLAVSYAATHLQHQILPAAETEDVEESAWIEFVTGPLEPQGGRELEIEFPVALRTLPRPPAVAGQAAFEAHPGATDPAELMAWSYSFSYLHKAAAQDEPGATVEWSTSAVEASALGDSDMPLFAALAQFVTVWPEIDADLEAFLGPLDAEADAAPSEAVSALAAMEGIIASLASAYEAGAAQGRRELEAKRPAKARYEFSLRLRKGEEGEARIDVVEEARQPADAAIPVPRVKIAGCEETEAPTAPGARASWTYTREDGSRLGYEEARAVPKRAIEFGDLDLRAAQDASASLRVTRNERLVEGGDTDPGFVLSSSTAAFARPVVPLLEYRSFQFAPATDGAGLAGHLDTFFSQLLAGGAPGEWEMKLAAGYAYPVSPGNEGPPETVLPILRLGSTPVDAVPPSFISGVAEEVAAWLGELEQVAPGSRLTFELELFSRRAGAGPAPLLIVRDLFAPLA